MKSELTQGQATFSDGHAAASKSFGSVLHNMSDFSEALPDNPQYDLVGQMKEHAARAAAAAQEKLAQPGQAQSSAASSAAGVTSPDKVQLIGASAASPLSGPPGGPSQPRADYMSLRARKHASSSREHQNIVGTMKLVVKQGMDALSSKGVDSDADKHFLKNLQDRTNVTLEILGCQWDPSPDTDFKPKYDGPEDAAASRNREQLKVLLGNMGALQIVEDPSACVTLTDSKAAIDLLPGPASGLARRRHPNRRGGGGRRRRG